MKRQLAIHCAWVGCTTEFGDAEECRLHCIAHIDAHIAIALKRQKMPHPSLPPETWTEVVASCDQTSLAERVSFVRRQFHAISRPLLDGPKGRILPEMAFIPGPEADNAILVKCARKGENNPQLLVELPIAEVPPPQSVVGFSVILLNCFNAKVLSFLCTISPLLRDIHLRIATYTSLQWLNQWERGEDGQNLAVLECLLRVFPRLVITSLCISFERNLLSADLLARLLVNVRHLRIHSALPKPESVSLAGLYSRNSSPHLPVLVKWLHSPLGDGQPKLADIYITCIENLSALFIRAQEHFLSANSAPTPYFVALYWYKLMAGQRVELPFHTLHNEHTHEVLSLRHYNNPLVFNHGYGNRYNFLLYRRVCATTPTEESDGAELLEMHETYMRELFTKESRNKIELSVAQMGFGLKI